MRVVVRVHYDAAYFRTSAHVAFSARFAQAHKLVIEVAHLTDRRLATSEDVSHLAAGKTERRVLAFFRHQLSRGACGLGYLSAASRLHFDVVYERTDGNVRERQSVARFDVRVRSAYYGVSDVESDGRENVSLFAVSVMQERDVCRAARIVFDAGYLCGYAVLVSLEIDYAVFRLFPPPR